MAMISPEILRRYPFWGFLDSSQLTAVAMITEEVTIDANQRILEAGAPAQALYFLVDGGTELYHVVADPVRPELCREFYVGDIDPGEVFGISALIEPYRYTGTIRTTTRCRVLKIDGDALRGLITQDLKLASGLMYQTARAAMERLNATRIQLVAARA